MPANRFHLAPHSLTFAADDHQRNRWTLAAYIAPRSTPAASSTTKPTRPRSARDDG